MTYSYEDIRDLAEVNNGIAVVELKKAETAWNPSSTKRLILGPAKVIYRWYPDGGVEATLESRST